MNIFPYETKQHRQLRFDIATLERELTFIEKAIADFHTAQYAFEREYQNRLGDLSEAVVVLRAQLGMIDHRATSSVPITQLADKDYQQLKRAYRQAAKLCHPDNLSANQQEVGLELFDSLNKAYHLQDLVLVEHILWLLQSGQAFSQTPISIRNPQLLERRKALLLQLITQKADHLTQLKMREDYDITNHDNWNILLYDYQTQLEDELALLRAQGKRRANEVTSSK